MKIAHQLLLFTEDQIHPPPQNQREAVLYYLSKMDLEMVSLILDDQRTYDDATKEVFISKLTKVLSKFSSAGDTELQLIPGYCNSGLCNGYCKGFALMGNNSNYQLNLIVEQTLEEILDIYHCSSFTIRDSKHRRQKELLSYDIGFDEKANFNPPPQFWIDVQLSDKAHEEFVHASDRYTDFNFINQWMNKYESVFESINEFEVASVQQEFYNCFKHLKLRCSVNNTRQPATDALFEFQSKGICKKIYNLLLKWLVEQENLYKEISQVEDDILSQFFLTEDDTRGLVNLYSHPIDFEMQIKFLKLFKRYYSVVYAYYESLPSKHVSIIIKSEDEYLNKKSLKLLLEEKGIDY